MQPKLPKYRLFRVYLDDSSHYDTRSHDTIATARKYFIGRELNIGTPGASVIRKCVNVERCPKSKSSLPDFKTQHRF